MEPDLEPDSDDLPLRANVNHMRVRHYVLDLTVQLHSQVIAGNVVLFLEPVAEPTDGAQGSEQTDEESTGDDGDFTLVLDCCDLNVTRVEEVTNRLRNSSMHQAVDVTSVPSMSALLNEVRGQSPPQGDLSAAALQRLVSMPSLHWRQQHRLFSECCGGSGGGTPNPGSPDPDPGPVGFLMDRWSLQVKKKGVSRPLDFPRALRVSYETRPEGRSVRWTQDQDHRVCVYTAGSPINNRALFPCQEPPAAMATWQARVRAPGDCVVLTSGENQALPRTDPQTGLLIWDYYVTMPMPASTFTLAVGSWHRATRAPPPHAAPGPAGVAPASQEHGSVQADLEAEPGAETGPESGAGSSSTSGYAAGRAAIDDDVCCSHSDYPCRFSERSAWTQRLVPHRVFAPPSLLQEAQLGVLALLPRCLEAAHAILGVHPFPRLDVLVVPPGFSSLGMASPHIIFLSQSVLDLAGSGSGSAGGGVDRSLLGSRLCHELAHSWFGLAIGARDWTEEWLSEGFATYLEDVVWARAQQLLPEEEEEQGQVKALLRWRRLSDELRYSQEELQVLRPCQERTGEVNACGASLVKHALNPDKTFMQVHYLKGYFLLTFLASEVGEREFVRFLRQFVMKYHGQLVLSQDFLCMLLSAFPDMERRGLTLATIHNCWMDTPGIPKWLAERSSVWSDVRRVDQVKAEVVKWTLPGQGRKGRSRKRRRTGETKKDGVELTSDQLVLLLELLLEEERLTSSALTSLNTTYHLHTQDAEVRHRWCELVVKHGHSKAYQDVQHFLVHDQAMGVYLYGELMVQEKAEQQALARRCLSLVQDEMDQSARRVVEEMVL